MTKATVDGVIIAESSDTVRIEGNYYFPPNSVNMKYFSEPTDLHTLCHWKGQASYRDVTVNSQTLKNVAWFYADPDQSAKDLVGIDFANYVAFYPQVTVVD